VGPDDLYERGLRIFWCWKDVGLCCSNLQTGIGDRICLELKRGWACLLQMDVIQWGCKFPMRDILIHQGLRFTVILDLAHDGNVHVIYCRPWGFKMMREGVQCQVATWFIVGNKKLVDREGRKNRAANPFHLFVKMGFLKLVLKGFYGLPGIKIFDLPPKCIF
jgi:hypothetical protein